MTRSGDYAQLLKALCIIEDGAAIDEVVRALNAIGATPRDIFAIIQAIKAAGAVQATLEII